MKKQLTADFLSCMSNEMGQNGQEIKLCKCTSLIHRTFLAYVIVCSIVFYCKTSGERFPENYLQSVQYSYNKARSSVPLQRCQHVYETMTISRKARCKYAQLHIPVCRLTITFFALCNIRLRVAYFHTSLIRMILKSEILSS